MSNTAIEIARKIQNREYRNGQANGQYPSQVSRFVEDSLGPEVAENIYWISPEGKDDHHLVDEESWGLGSLKLMNQYRELNKYLRDLNAYLDNGEPLVLCVETKDARKNRIFSNYPPGIRQLSYLFDFAVNRVMPKLKLTRSLYNFVKRSNYRVLTLTESLARLVYTAYKIVDYKFIDGLTYIIAEKKCEPISKNRPHYGVVIKLPRIGKGGEITHVYKIRTMHPYSEYLQEYMFLQFGTEDGDKIENDFRKTRWGTFFREYWLDEIPMIWNLIKGDLKLIGVRPLSKQKFDTYPEYLKEKRTQVKPGLIPPYYADIPETPAEFFETEDRYLESYFKHPVWTDIRYFFKCLYNILIKGHRSR